MRREDRRNLTAGQLMALNTKTADAARKKRNPYKTCRQCWQVKPNDLKHFARSGAGRISSICLVCAPSGTYSKPEPAKRIAEPAAICPLCRESGPLVIHREAPLVMGLPVKICRRCMVVVGISSGRDLSALDRIKEYIEWVSEPDSWTRPGQYAT